MAAPSFAPPLPGDIRLMNATAGVLALLGAAALAAAGLLWVLKQPVFAVRAIRVDGEVTRNSASTIRANALPHLAGNFFTLDLAAARRAFESVPWVRRAEVRRVWPSRLAVKLEEHRALALWSSESGADKLVDSFGDVFEANLGDVEDDRLPTLSGPDGNAPHMLQFFARLAPVLSSLGTVDALVLSGRGSWRVALDSGAEIELGRGTDADVIARTERFVDTLPQVATQLASAGAPARRRLLESADLRHNGGYAVRLKGVTTGAEAPPKPIRK